MTGSVEKKQFADMVLDKPTERDHAVYAKLFILLEGQKYSLFMFTSCGWFFADISGIEPVKNMEYAYKAIRLYQPYCSQDILAPLLESLEKAKSNIKEEGTGKDIMLKRIIPMEKGLDYPASVFILSECLGSSLKAITKYGVFERSAFTVERSEQEKRMDFKGAVRIADTSTTAEETYLFRLTIDEDYNITLRLKDSEGKEQDAPLDTLPEEIRSHLVTLESHKVENGCSFISDKYYDMIREAVMYGSRLKVPRRNMIQRMAETAVNSIAHRILAEADAELPKESFEKLEDVFAFARAYKIPLDKDDITPLLTKLLKQEAMRVEELIEAQKVNYLCSLIELPRIGGIDPEITILQNEVFALIKDKAELYIRAMESGDISGFYKIKSLLKLATELGINVDSLKRRVFDP